MNNHNKQKGLGLVEIMISMLIASFLLVGMISLFTGNKRTYLYQQAQSLESDSQRFASTLFSLLFHQIGHAPLSTKAIDGKHMVFKDDDDFIDGQVLFSEIDSASNAQMITYRYSAGENIVDCRGEDFELAISSGSDPDDSSDDVILPTQRVETLSLSERGYLQCTGKTFVDGTWTDDPAPTVLIGDVNVPVAQQLRVTDLRFTFGVDSDGDGSVDITADGEQMTGMPITHEFGNQDPTIVTSSWQRVKLVNVFLSIQSGFREPQTLEYSVELANLLDTPQ